MRMLSPDPFQSTPWSSRSLPVWLGAILGAALLLSSGCSSGAQAQDKGGGQAPPPLVSVTEVQPRTVPTYSEYAAQTFARDMVEVRGRVDGYIEKRLFQVGTDVRTGQDLYVLDLRPYQAEVEKAKGQVAHSEASLEFAKRQVALLQAQADLAQAQANLLKAQQDVKRLQPLVQQDAAAQQDLDNALAAAQANEANVNARKAAVEQSRLQTSTQIATAQAQLETDQASLRAAQLNLDYATIKAPVSGRIGDSLVQVGGLVSHTSPQPLTTIVPLDPIWVRFKVSEAEYLEFQRRQKLSRTLRTPLELILADGTPYPHKGRFENTLNQVDPKTGTLEIQATFPNPEHLLLPGQFGRVRLESQQHDNALLVPQKAVQEIQGVQSVFTVGADGKVVARTVVTGDRSGEQWIITQGLKPGDLVVVEGIQKVRPGQVVKTQPYRPSAN